MIRLKSHLWVSVFVLVLALAGLTVTEVSRALAPPQETERVLEIQRYPDEPLELVNFKIGTRSVKDRIHPRFEDKSSKWGIDRAKFNEKHDWVRRVSITLRSVSDKPIYGVQGHLIFEPLGFPMLFGIPLTNSKELQHQPLRRGDEIELSVNQSLLDQILEDAKRRGADLTGAVVSFSLDTAIFSDDLQWYRGKILRPDSEVPGKWVPVDETLAATRRQSSGKTPSFVPASFAPADTSRAPAPSLSSTCTEYNNSFFAFACNGETNPNCLRRVDQDDNINPGLRTLKPLSETCLMNGDTPAGCTVLTTHTRMQVDPTCTPCPDADGDGFQSRSCGGQDCNDGNNAIFPGATENCSDGVDSNCNDLHDDIDFCSCPQWEGSQWVPGGGWDCSTCEDIYDNDCDGDTNWSDSGCNPHDCASPVLIDVSGNGFDLSNAANGVNFDLNSDGAKEKLSWTLSQTDDAWLALDRNGNGVINDGTELFGNFTPQPDPPAGMGRNGFNALVEYDRSAKGGNGDGLITERDTVFTSLLLWQDKNHNGVSEANELHTLKQLGLTMIECDYKLSRRRDQYGNSFRYRAKVVDVRDKQFGRWAYDVFLLREQASPVNSLFAQGNSITRPSLFRWYQKVTGAATECTKSGAE